MSKYPVAVLSMMLVTAMLPAHAGGRDAPFVSELPRTDGADLFMFRSYESGKDDRTILIATFQAGQGSQPGHALYLMSPEAHYQIHIDNTGDAIEDITFRFQFQNQYQPQMVTTDDGTPIELPFMYMPQAPLQVPADPQLAVVEQYTMTLVLGSGPSTNEIPCDAIFLGGPWFIKPADWTSEIDTVDYAAYADQHIWDWAAPGLPGLEGRVFIGQRDDPFVISLDHVFDLSLVDPNSSNDKNAYNNVTAFAIEVPTVFLTGNGAVNAFAGWTSVTVPEVRQLNPAPVNPDTVTFPQPPNAPRVQVSRLGHALVNELVIGIGAQDRFNASQPQDDAQFVPFFTNLGIAELFGAPSANRNDLFNVFLTGIPGVNQDGSTAEMLRLSVDDAPITATQQDPLGLLGGDDSGYPNGRRPGDDVVDITLQLAQGELFGMPNDRTDGAATSALEFPDVFPFLNEPTPGDADLECNDLARSQSAAGGFLSVPGAYADGPDQIAAPIDPAPLEYFLLQSPTLVEAEIATMGKEPDRLRFYLQK